jgi:predicted DNA-binding transcriptional regulator AlpA
MENHHDLYVSIKEVRQIVRLSASSVYNLVKTGDFPNYFKIGKKNFWSLNLLRSWLAEKAEKAANKSKN